jgi:hypothetical protein
MIWIARVLLKAMYAVSTATNSSVINDIAKVYHRLI